MKKLNILILMIISLTACDLGNTPTAQVEELLGNYQRYTKEVTTTYLELTGGITLTTELQRQYEDLIEQQYHNLSYEVKDEEIDGDNAVVKVEIEVTNYQKSFEKYNLQNNEEEYYQKLAEDMKEQKEKVVYTIDFEVQKNEQGKWKVSSLSEEEHQKLLGIYSE